jgi:predicted ferric reductase
MSSIGLTTGGPPLRLRPAAVRVGIVVGAVLVLLLWWHDTTSVHGLGDWLTNAGRITGLLAGYAVAVQLLLMARVPAIERGVGADRLARWHSFGGRYTVSLVSAHVLLIIWGYAVTAHTDVVSQTTSLLTTYPDVMMATAAFGLLLGVGAVSARAARARLRYETWYYLHLYTYLAVALAFSHQFSTGADFVDNLAARVLWGALYVTVAVLLLWHRFAVPARMMVRHRMHVSDIRVETPGVVSLLLAGDHLHELRVEPGQFFRWRFLTREGWWQSHPYSLSAAPRPGHLRITVKSLGDHSTQLQHVRRGTRVLVEGPYGAFTARRRTRPKVLLLAGGVGITPLRALFETLPAAPGDLTLLYRATTDSEILFRHELDTIAASRQARLDYLVGPPGAAADPFVGDRLGRLVGDIRRHEVFVCGPAGFMAAARTALLAAGVPTRHIHDEQFVF